MELKQGLKLQLVKIWFLLIVPYGIETALNIELLPDLFPFNCTLWN